MAMSRPREVVEGNDDILIEVLTCLPPNSVFRFMSVSKRWKNIIDNPFFRRAYSRRRRSSSGGGRLLALFQQSASQHLNPSMINYIRDHSSPTNMLTINCTSSGGDRIKDIPVKFGRFINSSNGLILCSDNENSHLHVMNPVTEKWVTLPPPPRLPIDKIYPFTYGSVGLMCQENTSELTPNYIVIRVHTRIPRCGYMPVRNNTMQIQTYSSKTGEWALSTLVANGEIILHSQAPMVANGVFHWFGTRMAVYDPNDDQNHVQLIEVPSINNFHYSIGRSPPDDDILWLANIDYVNPRMKVWMLPKGEDWRREKSTIIAKKEWVLMHNITRGDHLHRYINFSSSSISLAFISWNPQLVALLFDQEKLILYNVDTPEFVEEVRYDGGIVSRHYYLQHVCPYFVEYSFLSSYAL